ncbi:DUF5672 family protein [Desulfopila sp. IMCC35008]|uniref:DUF5672 family protein n=1 Tax=Desulfopila sp. IMCC35008 TaxID=2653858 RepID=UPI0013D4ECD6|nr:DUF5672 family protein [Desulfopila sp. IMCC35008]
MEELVTVVVPIWKDNLSKFEKISLEQNSTILNKHHFTIATNKNVDLERVETILSKNNVNYSVKYFHKDYFTNIEGYNRLLLSLRFYLKFVNFKYILICQLDTFVFKDDLVYWVNNGYSYIGAPWLECYESADERSSIIGIGNGGLSLRNVTDQLKVLLTFKYIEDVHIYRNNILNTEGTLPGRILLFLKMTIFRNNTFFLFNNWKKNEDIFWCTIGSRNTWYNLPNAEIASQFSVELQPERFIKGDETLPFGCHAWWKYDLEFWKPYINSYGHDV